MTTAIKVLYIDDEEYNLDSFKASLRKEFNIVTVINPLEALDIVSREEFQVVIADQRMPEITGVEFFESMVKINPDPIRILLTGYSDIASVINAINKGEVYRFIDKPWNIEEIKNAIYNAGEVYTTRKELKEKNYKLKKIQAEMNQFVYALSHELRGPLMSISGISKLAKSESQDPEIIEYFELIDSATVRLDEFIYKMLDFHRSTKFENKPEQIDVKGMIEQIKAPFQHPDAVQWELDIQQSAIFFSDDAKLRVILSNLISNAFKFQKNENPDKHVQLSIEIDSDQAILILKDNGIGIDSRFQADVFNLFHKATQTNAGSGLGLYMVKESVEQLGGTVSLQSTLGLGTQVTVILPNMRQ